MSKAPERNHKRDKALIADYKSKKFSTAKLVARYNISMTRIYQVLDFYKVKRIKHDRSRKKANQ